MSNKEIIIKIIDFYKTHPSIKAIKENCTDIKKCLFKEVTEEDILKKLENLDVKKSIREDGISPRILKLSSKVRSKPLTKVINSRV